MTDDSDWQDWSPAPTGSSTGFVPPTTESDWKDYDPSAPHSAKTTPAQAIQYGIVNAVPFGRDVAAAAETYLPRWASGAPANVSNDFASNRARINATNQQVSADYPTTSALLPLAVGAAALPIAGPMEAASTGIARLIPRLAGTAADTLASGAVGAGYGAAYGAGSGNSLADRLARAKTGAELGGIGGAAIPPIAGALGGMGSAVGRQFQGWVNPAGAATDDIARRIASDQANRSAAMSPMDLFTAQTEGQPAVVGDMGGTSTGRLARRIANTSDEAAGAMRPDLEARFATQGPRFTDYVNGLYGDLNAQVARDRIVAQAKATNTPAYQRAYSDGASGVWNPGETVLDKDGNQVPNLQDLIKAQPVKDAIGGASGLAANDAVLTGRPIVRNPFVQDAKGDWQLGTVYNPKNVATGTELQGANVGGNKAVPALEFWDKVKQGLDDQTNAAYRTGNKYQGSQIAALKNALVTNLDQEVPSYATARQGASEFFKADNALEAGENFLGMSKVADIDGMKKAVANYTPAEQAMFSRGLASQIVQKAQNASERSNIVNLFNSPETAEKMQVGLGANAAPIEAYLRRESAMERFRNALAGGSNTTELASSVLSHVAGAVANPTVGALSGAYAGFHESPSYAPSEMLPRMAAGAATGAFMGALKKQWSNVNEAVANHVAEQLVSPDPTQVQAAIMRVSRNPAMMQGLRKVEQGMGYVAGRTGGTQGQE